MKKFIILALAVTTFLSCKKESVEYLETSQTTHLSGKIAFADSVNIAIIQLYTYDYLLADYEEYTADIAADGTFDIEFPLNRSLELTAIAGTPFSFIASPGDSIYVDISQTVADGVGTTTDYKFSGSHALTNQKFQEYKTDFPIDLQQFYDRQDETAMEEFIAYAKAEQKTLIKFNNQFLKENEDPLLEDYIKAQEKYYFPTAKIDFINYRSYYGLDVPEPTDAYFNFINKIPELKNQDLINSGTVQRLIYNLTYHYRNIAMSTLDVGSDDDAVDIKAIELAAKNKRNGLLYDYVIHDLYFKGLSNHNIAIYENTKDQLEKRISNESIRNSVIGKYNAEKKLLESPELPEGAELLDFESENPEEYLSEIVKNANGKVVYIDNWATWCGPCKVEFKEASPKLHEKFNEEVEFVYFCHQSERRAYIPSIAEFQIKGKHYFLTNEESTVINRMINLEGYPTYTIFNKAGEMVLSDYIHRPSYPQTTELLTKLTNE